MKIKKIGSICARNKVFALMHGPNGEQWLGNGEAMYKLEGLPQLTAATLPPLFDIPHGKTADMTWRETDFPEVYDVSDYDAGDRELIPEASPSAAQEEYSFRFQAETGVAIC